VCVSQADTEQTNLEIAVLRKKRAFKKFTYRGVDLDKLLDLNHEELMELVNSRQRRRFSRGLKRKPMALIKRLRKAKAAARPLERPEGIKTHLRNMIIVPEMIGSVVGVYNGKVFNGIEIKVCSRTSQCSRGVGALPEEWRVVDFVCLLDCLLSRGAWWSGRTARAASARLPSPRLMFCVRGDPGSNCMLHVFLFPRLLSWKPGFV
jgi:small subunit ribosomal protein S15e